MLSATAQSIMTKTLIKIENNKYKRIEKHKKAD
jgi:hypothetical protein